MKNYIHKIPLIFLGLAGVVLIALQIQLWGWLFLVAGTASLLFCKKDFSRDMLLIYISLAILGITPITTDISYMHMFWMGTTLGLAVVIPYLVSRFLYKDHHVRYNWHHGRNWYKTEIFYILLTAIIAYFFLPFYLRNTNAYVNWSVEPGVANITRLFIGTNALGIWDELFFVSTVLGILRRYVTFQWANLIQAVLFTSFLYELGFTGWGPIMVYLFALLQGYVFSKTESLIYVITIHLTLDFILFLALIHAHHPSWMPIFIT
jgi:hypothetical protein